MSDMFNSELVKVLSWLHANRFSLNIDKSRSILFHGPWRRLCLVYSINQIFNQFGMMHSWKACNLGVSLSLVSWNYLGDNYKTGLTALKVLRNRIKRCMVINKPVRVIEHDDGISKGFHRPLVKIELDKICLVCNGTVLCHSPDSKVHGANMGPIWGRQDPVGPHVGPMNFAFWEATDELDKTR